MPASRRISPSASASTAAVWKGTFWPRYGARTPEAMVESALCHIAAAGKVRFCMYIVISIKNSNVPPHDGSLPPAQRRPRLPAPCGRHRGRYHRQMGLLKAAWASAGCCWRASAIPSACRWLPEPEKRWRQASTSCAPWASRSPDGGHHLPHLRTHPVPLHRDRQRGGKAAAGLQKSPSRWP